MYKLKKNKSSKKYSKKPILIMISVIDNMGNTNKTVIHTPKLRTSQ